MSKRVFIDVGGRDFQQEARISETATVSRLVPAIVTQLELPVTDPSGRPIIYHLGFGGRRLNDDDTLGSAGVADGDTLSLVTEMTAGCFPAGTQVVMSDGSSSSINVIVPGDTVSSYDVNLHVSCTSKVERILCQRATSHLVINDFLRITGSHLVFSDGRWKPARDLSIGDNLMTQSGDLLPVRTINEVQIDSLVYNLHLAETIHTFFADGVLVHNAARKLQRVIHPDIPPILPTFAEDQKSHCALYGLDRQQVIQEITEAIEARLLVSIITPRQEAKQADSQSAIVVRPVFGPPVSSATVDCDVFMMMPFAEAFQSIYDDYIKPVATDANLKIRRADDFFTQHNIMNEIWTALCVCRFAIADCTGRNPNVLYELGIAHTLGKRVILLSQSEEDIPFDVKARRVIIYKDRSAGLKHLQRQLSHAVEVILAELQSDDESQAKGLK